MAPLINEANGDHGTRAQPFLATMLVLDYGKLANNCLFIAGDNCSVNRRLASRMGVPLEGCASHRLKLAVQAYLKRYEEDLAQIQALMRHQCDVSHTTDNSENEFVVQFKPSLGSSSAMNAIV
ncbi:hypothetical protein PPTG_20638 [Phytophthora nicotianae INRA-310]|uniref:Uncharacterized protein n=1 Tax=Phytophthora nicotianae (strain INRA-310) TaxID=761204 RepID=W2RDH1_PHYN3|nr:hypothetical protein PPTG_20638 [Phytophthora nicotianae INRA-310]ETN23432.1 hypothetical protein PPTG_20638 [Phytophthora nicotianae INRA-310]